MKVLVTGANGFIGRALCSCLLSAGYQVVAVVRRPHGMAHEYVIGEDTSKLELVLQGCDALVHLAGRAHVMHEETADPLQAFRTANVDASVRWAMLASKAGVRRFVFMSSIKVNGEFTSPNRPFAADDAPAPEDTYGLSKWEAEQALQAIAQTSGMELVVIRPPLVYGPGVKGNFAKLIQWVKAGVPLPFACVHNKRSMVGLDNLVRFIALCTNFEASPKAAGQVFLVSDGDDVSTAELLRRVASAYACQARLLPAPVWLLSCVAAFLRRSNEVERLLGSLTVDDSKARELLGWKPSVTMDEQLRKMANAAPH
jgi:nucleoside-diphosphate-sugar epimerase